MNHNNFNMIQKAFEGHQIRIMDKEQCYVCLRDILNVIGLNNNSKLIQKTVKECQQQDFLESEDLETNSGIQSFQFLPEFYVYKILFRSNKPNAQQFQKMIYDTIKELERNNQNVLQGIIQQHIDKERNRLSNQVQRQKQSNAILYYNDKEEYYYIASRQHKSKLKGYQELVCVQLGNGINFKVQFKQLLRNIPHGMIGKSTSKFMCENRQLLIELFNEVFEQRLE